MKHTHYRSTWGLIGGLVLVGLAGVIVWRVEPVWWVEVGVMGLFWLGNLLVWRWVTGARKWGWIIATGLVGLLVLNRLNWLDGVTLGLLLIILGLISLIN